MRARILVLLLLLWSGAGLCRYAVGAPQRPAREEREEPGALDALRERPGVSIPDFQFQQERQWTIFGRVMTPTGQPISGAKVRVNTGAAAGRPRTLQTSLQGEFSTQYALDAKRYTKLSVEVAASKPDYLKAWETADFEVQTGTREFILVLREDVKDSALLPLATLIESLAPRFRGPGAGGPASAPARKEYQQGLEKFLDNHDPVGAVPILSKVAKSEPECVECRVVLSLAHLDAGGWVSASRQLAEVTKLGSPEKAGTIRPEPFFILGVLETWRHQPKRATGFFLKAVEIQPDDPLVLDQLGRALVLQEKWDAAEKYLEKAIKLGASPEVRLLRARALLEMGEEEAAEEAEAEIKAFLAGRQPKQIPERTRLLYLELQERLQLKSYGEAKPLVSQPLADLMKAIPELKGLEPAQSAEGLSPLMQQVGESVEAFFRNFPNTISMEEIREERLSRDGKVLQSDDRKFNYLFLARPDRSGLGLDERRMTPGGADVASDRSRKTFMRTEGFACAPLVLLPAYQPGSSFRHLGSQVIDGRTTTVLAFAQQPGKAEALTEFNVDGKSLPVLMQGIVWIDPSTYQILRMRREVLKPPPKSRLEKLTTEIHFAEVKFKEIPAGFWLPHEVTVTVHWKKRIFRNRHHYSDFRFFRVETEEKRKAAGLVPEAPASPN